MHDRHVSFLGALALALFACGDEGEPLENADTTSTTTSGDPVDTTETSTTISGTSSDPATTVEPETSATGSSDDGDPTTDTTTGEPGEGATFLVVGHDENYTNSKVAEIVVRNSGVTGVVLADLPGEARQIARGTDGWIVVGATQSGGPLILHSTDGTTWTEVAVATEFGFFDVAFGDDVFAAAGPSSVASIDGGFTWTNHDFLARAIAWGDHDGGRFVTVQTSGPDTYVWSSSDGETWSGATLYEENLGAIGYGDGRFVAAGIGGSTQISTNGGVDWTPGGSVGSGNPTDIAYGAGRFVAVGYGPIVAHSADGLAWTPVDGIVEERLLAIAFDTAIGMFAIVGDHDTIVASTDGTAFVEHTADLGIGWISGIASAAN